ncbi:MAG: helix-turn-helix domain-containing protein [Enterococcus sp.]
MNIQHFVDVRKQSGFSQTELVDGICTQATLSRFENNGQVPSLKILIQLCNRLNLPIQELFPQTDDAQALIVKELNRCEFLLITSEFEQLAQRLAKIDATRIKTSQTRMQHYYLQGFVTLFQGKKLTDSLFLFDKLLLEQPTDSQSLFRLLALTGIGMAYSAEGAIEKAEYYFDQVFQQIFTYQIQTTEDTWRVLNIVLHCGEFFGEQGELEVSNTLLDYVWTLCSENHVTYYLARAAYQLALNAQQSQEETDVIREYLHDAKTFAKFNHNQILLDKISTSLATLV